MAMAEGISKGILRVIRRCIPLLRTVAIFSFAINILYLATPIYSLQVYDRVLNSGSIETLIVITVALTFALIAMSGLEYVRSNLLARLGVLVDQELGNTLFGAQLGRAAAPGSRAGNYLLRDLDAVRNFVAATPITALLDFPWTPIFIAVLLFLHPLIGGATLVAALILIALAVANELATKSLVERSTEAAVKNSRFGEASLRNAEVARALGMISALVTFWRRGRNETVAVQTEATATNSRYLSSIKFVRIFIQSAILGIGAYLVINRQLTIGGMFAASFLLGRTLAPVEQAVGMWKQFVTVRAAVKRLNAFLRESEETAEPMPLPAPRGMLSVEKISFAFPKSDRAILKGVSFNVRPGEALAIVGPSASGKSSLARMLVGVWKPVAGSVRLDGADVFDWAKGDLGRYVGYVPQDIELFSGTVQQNIARFQDGCAETVVQAATLAGIHAGILRLPSGYDTDIGENGAALSGGQRQRIALARALFGRPRLVVMDEPNSNLDSEGEESLRRLILALKEDNVAVVVISHRPNIMTVVDSVLILQDGAVEKYGTVGEILPQLMPGLVRSPSPAAAG